MLFSTKHLNIISRMATSFRLKQHPTWPAPDPHENSATKEMLQSKETSQPVLDSLQVANHSLVNTASSHVELKVAGGNEVFFDMRNQIQNSWRIAMRGDQKLSFSYHGGSIAANKSTMVLHTDGSIHFH